VKIYDVSMPLREGMPVYRNSVPFRRPITRRIAGGDSANESRLELGCHAGTHVDAPLHFIEGAAGAERIPPAALLGPARLVHLPDRDAIDAADLGGLAWEGVERVLFRTRNSDHWARGGGFNEKYVALTGPAAEFLAARGMKLVGIDSLGIERFGTKGHPAHKALLGAGIAVLEGLVLAEVPPGDYWLFCGPLRLEGSDGAPARAFLVSGFDGGGR
jgi:arylformamidase